jgi:hypothetical protein
MWSWKEMWVNDFRTRGILLENGMVPRGPGVGCHVAPWLWWLKILEFVGIKPQTSNTMKIIGKG